MDPNFWLKKWETREIAFHLSEANPMLVRYFKELKLPKQSRIFLPLCGKTLDIHWLLSQGYRVAGAELSVTAIEELFSELEIKPQITPLQKHTRYSAPNLDIFTGDIFDLSKDQLGPVDAVYDRASLMALPPRMRNLYTAHLLELTFPAPQLLICFEYDSGQMEGPPFSISAEELKRHYAASFHLTPLARENFSGGLRDGKIAAQECVWLFQKR